MGDTTSTLPKKIKPECWAVPSSNTLWRKKSHLALQLLSQLSKFRYSTKKSQMASNLLLKLQKLLLFLLQHLELLLGWGHCMRERLQSYLGCWTQCCRGFPNCSRREATNCWGNPKGTHWHETNKQNKTPM